MHRPMSRRRSTLLPLAVAVALVAVGGVAAGTWLADDGKDATSPSTSHASERRAPESSPAARASATPTAPPIAVVRGAAARRTAVPILMYHVLGTPPASAPLPELWVSTARFREQMAALSRAGYQAITLKAAFSGWNEGGPLPRKPVVVSFDDGYLSHATVAAPTLRRYGWPGVVNLAVQDLGPDGLPRHLAQEMVAAGWEFDSHTLTHPDLRTVDDARLRKELVGSRRRIKQLLGVEPRFFCYPAGKYDARVAAAVRAAGYDGATTVEPGIARRGDQPYELPRVRITNADTGTALVARLRATS